MVYDEANVRLLNGQCVLVRNKTLTTDRVDTETKAGVCRNDYVDTLRTPLFVNPDLFGIVNVRMV